MIGPKQGNGVDDMRSFLTRLQDASSDPKTRKNMLEKFNKGRRKNRDLSNGNFEGKNLSGIFLASADLQGANLRGANLRGAELQKATLKNAILDDAFLNGADLSGANLNFAQIKDADLQGATLDDADIQQACLKKADLSMASLKNARLYGSDLTDTKFKKANLEGAKLNKCRIEGSDFSDATFNTFRPLPKEASRPIGTWRLRVVTSETTRRCCAGLLDNALEESEEDDDFMEDDEELGLLENGEAPGGNRDDNLSDFGDIVDEYVDKTVKVVKPAIAFLNLMLQTLDLALEKSLEILTEAKNISDTKDETKKAIREKASIIITLLLEVFIIESIELNTKILGDDQDQGKGMKDRLQAYFDKLKDELKLEDVVSSSDVEELAKKIEVDEFLSIKGIWEESINFFHDEVKKFFKQKILPTVESEIDEVLTGMFQRMDTFLGVHGGEISRFENFSRKLYENLRKLLTSGVEKTIINLLSEQCNDAIAKLAKTAEHRMKVTEAYETLLIEKMESAKDKMKTQFDRFFKKGSLNRRYMTHMMKKLKTQTKYIVNVNGNETTIDHVLGALRFSRVDLNTDEAELNYLLEKLVTIGDMEVTIEKWRDAAQTWFSLLNLRPQLKAERSVAVIDCIVSDPEVIKALSIADALLNSLGGSDTLVAILSNEPGRHIRDHGYRYQRSIRQEIVRIQKIRETQGYLISTIGTVVATALIALFNYIFTLGSVKKYHGEWFLPVLVISVIFAFLLFMFLLVKYCQRRNPRRTSDASKTN